MGKFITLAVGPGYWPSNTEWTILTVNGNSIADREERAGCNDPSKGSAAPSAANDVASQAYCQGGGTKYNPGLIDEQFGTGTQPNSSNARNYSAATYYSDPNEDSLGCSNISDDWLFFRVRLAANPVQNNPASGLTNDYWWATLDIDADSIIDFYVRVNGNGGVAGTDPAGTENIQLLYETSGDADPTGEPILQTYLNPLNTAYARSITTDSNGIVGDNIQYFLDWTVPVSHFKDTLGNQILCEGNTILLTNYSTSANGNDPFQKDRIVAFGSSVDPVVAAPPEYEITKTASDINGDFLIVGDSVEYTITARNLSQNLSDFVFTDQIPSGGTYLANSIKVVLDGTEYSMTDSADSPDAGGCSPTTHCRADYNISNPGAITVYHDWLYAKDSLSPLYDEVIIKFRVTFSSIGQKSNQGFGTTRELPNKQLTDDPAFSDGVDCTTALTYNCNDGIVDNDDPSFVTVHTLPDLSTSTKSEDDADNIVLPGQTVKYTITLNNTGTITATGVDVFDLIDPGFGSPLNFSYTNCGSSYSNFSTSNVHIENLVVDAGGFCTVSYDVNVDTPYLGDFSLDNSFTSSVSHEGGVMAGPYSASTLTVDTTPNLSTSTKTDDDIDNLVANNQTINYTISLINTGDGIASGVDLGDILDSDLENLTVNSLTNCGSSYTDNSTASPSVLDISDLTVSPLANCIVNFSAKVKAGALNGATVPNSATVSSAFEGGLGAIVSSDTLTVASVPDLSTSTKSENDADNIVVPGQTVKYTLTIKNTGTSSASGVDIFDDIDPGFSNPGNFTFSNCGGAYTNNSASDVDIIGLFVSTSDDCVVEYEVVVDNPFSGDYTIDNSFTVSPAIEGGLGAGPILASTLIVDTTPDLSTSTKTEDDADNLVIIGQTVKYTITLINSGDGLATGVDVFDSIDDGFGAPFNFSLLNCGLSYSNNSLNDLDISNLEIVPGLNCVITYDVSVDNPFLSDETLSNSFTATPAFEGGPGAGPISATYLTVDTTPDLSTSLKYDDDADNIVLPNQTITYTIEIKNTGDGKATGVSLDDTLSSSLSDLSINSITNCGATFIDSSIPNPAILDIDSLEIVPGTDCVVSFNAKVKSGVLEGDIISNTANIGAPLEGGVAQVVSSDNLTVDTTPGLFNSTKTENDSDNIVVPGDNITYTITIVNDGTGKGTGISLSDNIDSSLSAPTNFTFLNCGSSYVNSSAANVNISDLEVDVGIDCVITYDVSVLSPYLGDFTIENSAIISPAIEGGSGAGPLSADSLTVDTTPDFSASDKSDDDVDNLIIPGQTITYTLYLSNSGDGNATRVDLLDNLDSDLENLSVISFLNCGGSYSDLSVSNPPLLDLRDLSVDVGTDCIVTISAKAKEGLSDGSIISNSANISAAFEGGVGKTISSDNLTVDITPDLSTSTKSDDDIDNSITPGQIVSYLFTIKNTGNGLASGMTLIDNFDSNYENLSITSITNCGGGYVDSSTSNPPILSISGISATTSADCVVDASVKLKDTALGGSVVSNSATVSAPLEGGTGVTLNSDDLNVSSLPDLSTSTKTHDDADNFVSAGQEILYTITLINTGLTTGTGIDLTDLIDPDFGNPFDLSFLNCGGAYVNNSASNILINDLVVVPGINCVVTYKVKVNDPYTGDGTIQNAATVSPAVEGGSGAGPVSATNLILKITDLGLSLIDLSDPVQVGNNFVYNITITNNGPANSSGYSFTLTLSPNVGFVSANVGTCSIAGSLLTCTMSSLNSGISTNVLVTVRANTSGSAVSSASLISSNEADLNSSNNSAIQSTTLTTPSTPPPSGGGGGGGGGVLPKKIVKPPKEEHSSAPEVKPDIDIPDEKCMNFVRDKDDLSRTLIIPKTMDVTEYLKSVSINFIEDPFVNKKIEPSNSSGVTTENPVEEETELIPYIPGFIASKLASAYGAKSLFPDTVMNNIYYNAAVNLFQHKVISGYENRNMKLDSNVSRSETAKIVARAAEFCIPNELTAKFPDTVYGDWYQPYINYMQDKKIINGYMDGNYGPNDNVTFWQAMKIISNSFKLVSDAGKTEEQKVMLYYNAMLYRNLIPEKLMDPNLFNKALTRGELFELIDRTITMKDSGNNVYVDEINLRVPSFNVTKLAVKRTLLSEISVWLGDLVGSAGFYEDIRPGKENRLVIFGHSSMYVWDSNKYGIVFKPFVDKFKVGDQIIVEFGGVEHTYTLMERNKIDHTNVSAIRDPGEDVDLILFTCDKDLDYRHVFYFAKQ